MDSQVGSRPCALVTGASSGIGAALAVELASAGYDLVLVGRNRAALDVTAGRVVAGNAGAEVLPADLATEAGLEAVERRLTSREVHLLVNNAATGQFRDLHEQEVERMTETVTLNVLAPLRLLRAALPAMVAAGRGGVITVSSAAGEAPTPRLAPYGASRAFLIALDRSVRAELAEHPGIVVTTVLPGYTRTGFHARLEEDVTGVPDRLWVSPEFVAAETVRLHHLGRTFVRVPPPTPRERWGSAAGRLLPRPAVSALRRAVRAVDGARGRARP